MASQEISPNSLRDFFGQDKIKNRLKILFSKVERGGKFPASIFIYGPMLSGKSTLAKLIARKLEKEIVYFEPGEDSKGLISQILSARYPAIFVIDDLEQLKLSVQKLLAKIIKNKSLKISIEGEKELIKINLGDLIVIGISDRAGMVPKFIRENFSEIWHIERYKIREIKKIIIWFSKKQKVDLDNDAAWEIAHASRKNPKRAIEILEKIIDFAQNQKSKNISFDLARKALMSFGVDRIGLEKFDRDLLKTIIEKFGGGPVGIENFAARLGESPWNIEEIHEPYLIEIGFLKRTPRGRIATREAHEYLGYQYAVGKAPAKITGSKISRDQKKLL